MKGGVYRMLTIKCSIFGRERVSEAIGQNLQVWAAG